MGLSLKWLSLSMMLVQNSLTPIVIRLATTGSVGDASFDTATSVVMQELLKFVFSFFLIMYEEGGDGLNVVNKEVIQKPRDTLKLAVPAILYFIQNQCLQIAGANLPAAVFQVMYQGKTLVVAFFSIVLLSKELSRVKWLAIALMGMGLAVVQLADTKEGAQSSMANAEEQSMVVGLTFTVIGCLCSGFAGVYFEKMMKTPTVAGQKPPSMWVRNLQLAGFSIAVGACQIGYTRGLYAERPLLHGFTTPVWAMVVNSAIGGLCVAFVIKCADNILKGFACALATVVTAIMSVFVFGFSLDIIFAMGTMIVIGSTLLYGGTIKLSSSWWDSEPELCRNFRKKEALDDEDLGDATV